MSKRDPEARRTAIITAAADLVVELGPERLTHRRVAERAGVPLGSTTQYFKSIDELRTRALERLAAEIDDDLEAVRESLATSNGSIDALVDDLHDYLRNHRNLAADVSLMSAAAFDADLRELSLRWQNNLIDILTAYVGPTNAHALAILADGVTIHAVQHDAPLPKATLRAIVVPFMGADSKPPTPNEMGPTR
ncbi:MAG: TetR family transcriptional regulator [Gordonia sp. (in: high G+C Gram-positive bacteria)]|uniref:TetR/AcrR family transcriptional regulator n=1 Tax=Gordonia sp. (in: high G+C Gram-positive bacteria) TaxID=84139 RepID=UPI003C77F015